MRQLLRLRLLLLLLLRLRLRLCCISAWSGARCSLDADMLSRLIMRRSMLR
jgi:hypothetical protein